MPARPSSRQPREYAIKRFIPARMIDPNRIIVLIGRSGSGKSIVAKNILYDLCRQCHVGVIMSPTDHMSNFFGAHMPKTLVYDEFREDVVLDLLMTQGKRKKAREVLENDIATMQRMGRMAEVARLKQQLARREAEDRAFLVIDDCAYSTAAFRGTTMRRLFFQARHSNITVLVTVQYSLSLPPDARANAAYVISARENITQNRVKLYQSFFGVFPNLDDFERVYNACTQGYSFCVLDTTQRTLDAEKCVFHYTAHPRLPPFKLCSAVHWRFSDSNFDPNWEEKRDREKRMELQGRANVKKLK